MPAAIGLLLAACAGGAEPVGPAPVAPPTDSPWTGVATVPPRQAPIPEWWLRPDQVAAHSAAGTLAIKSVAIINFDLQAYYALCSPTPGPPQATASLTTTACPTPAAADRTAVAGVQSFGRVGDIELGVLHLPITDQPGQLVTLLVAPPGATAAVWSLSVVQQVAPLGHPEGMQGLGVDQETALPEVRIAMALGYGQHGTLGDQFTGWGGYFALAQPGTTPTSYLPSIFFVDAPDGTVAQISRADFLAGTLSQEGVSAFVPRPTYPPTPPPTGAAVQTPTPPYLRCTR